MKDNVMLIFFKSNSVCLDTPILLVWPITRIADSKADRNSDWKIVSSSLKLTITSNQIFNSWASESLEKYSFPEYILVLSKTKKSRGQPLHGYAHI